MTIMICVDCGESDDNVEVRELPNAQAGGPRLARLLCDTCARAREELIARYKAIDDVYPVQVMPDGSRIVLSEDECARLNGEART